MGDNKDLLDEIDKLDDNEEASASKAERESSHEKIFTAIIVIIIIAALVMLYLFYKGNYIVEDKENKQDDFSSISDDFSNNGTDNNDNVDENNTENELTYEEQEQQATELFNAQKNNLVISSQTLDVDGKLIATIHNGNQETIYDVTVQTIFYDGENKPIKIGENHIDAIEANSDYYMNFLNTPKGYERCDYLITKEYYTNYYVSHKNDVSFTVEEKQDAFSSLNSVYISGKNNSDDKLDVVSFALLYYNENNQLIAMRVISEYGIKKQEEFKIKYNIDLYSYEAYENINYSRYEVVLLDALTNR